MLVIARDMAVMSTVFQWWRRGAVRQREVFFGKLNMKSVVVVALV